MLPVQEPEPLWQRVYRLMQPEPGIHWPACSWFVDRPICQRCMEEDSLTDIQLTYTFILGDMLRPFLHSTSRTVLRDFLKQVSDETIMRPLSDGAPLFEYVLNIDEWLLAHRNAGCMVQHQVRRVIAQAVQARILTITRWEDHETTVHLSWNVNWEEWQPFGKPRPTWNNYARRLFPRLTELCERHDALVAHLRSLSPAQYRKERQAWIQAKKAEFQIPETVKATVIQHEGEQEPPPG